MHVTENRIGFFAARGKELLALTLVILLPSTSGCGEVPAEEAPPPAARAERLEDNGDGTVTDERTGLVWKRCVEGLSGADCATGTPALLSWGDALSTAEASSFAGHADWRLPNVRELRSLAALDQAAPAIDAGLFPGTPADVTWTGSPTVAATGNGAWIVHFDKGNANTRLRSNTAHVRLVRDLRIAGRFLPTGTSGERILDAQTGLEWERCYVGQTWSAATATCSGAPTTMTHGDAMALTPSDGFRVPTVDELRTLVVCSSGARGDWTISRDGRCIGSFASPALDTVAFPGGVSTAWTSSVAHVASNSTDYVYFVDFGDGAVEQAYAASAGVRAVRLVRVP